MKDYLVEKQLDWENSSIRYLGGKTSTGAQLLFVHGWGIGIEPYRESLNILSDRYQVIAPYLPGFGKSTAPLVRDYSDYARLMIDFINILKLPKVHLIGHSMGGAIAIALAALKPSLVRSLTIVDSTGIPLNSSLEVLLKRAIEMPAQMGQMQLMPTLEIIRCLSYNSLVNPHRVIQAASMILEKDIRPLLPRIEAPSLVLWGANDILTPITHGKEIAKGIKGSKLLVVDGVFHEWNFFFPDKFTAIVSNFIDEVETNMNYTQVSSNLS